MTEPSLEEEALYEEDDSFSNLYQPTERDLVEGTKTIYRTPIDNVFFIAEKVFEDDRGLFAQWGRKTEIESAIERPFVFAQGNMSKSREGVIRGIHAEYEDKLVTVASGVVLAEIVDCRPDSPTAKQVVEVLLGDTIHYGFNSPVRGSLFIEGKGIGNSFTVVEGVPSGDGQNVASYCYVVSKEYSALSSAEQQPLYMFDPTINIKWPTDLSVEEMLRQGLISKRDLLVRDGGSALEWDEFIERRRG